MLKCQRGACKATRLLGVTAAAALVASLDFGVSAQAHEWRSYEARSRTVAPASESLPNPQLTPGAVDPRVTQSNIRQTICRPGGYTRSVRPPVSYTEPLKREQIRQYGYQDHRLGDYEEDHLIPLEVGGSPTSPRNLWPEPHFTASGWGSYVKDRLENHMHDLVCDGRVSLAVAQEAFAGDNWINSYKRYVGPTPRPSRWAESGH